MLLVILTVGCRSPLPGNDGVGDVGSGDDATQPNDEETSSNNDGTDTTDADTDTNTNGFVQDGDLWPTEPAPCDPFVQNCLDGEKCVAHGAAGQGWIGYECVPVLGDKGAGEPCTYDGYEVGTDDCDATSACFDLFAGAGPFEGTCTPLCGGTADDPECDPGFGCYLSQSVTQTVCIAIWCDPLLDACEGMTDCHWIGDTFACINPLGAAGIGEPCTEPRDCLAPSTCMNAAVVPACVEASCCAPLCRLELGDAPCEAALPGTACVPFFEPDTAPEWFAHVGVCVLP
jgi:hypothetical protein